VALIDAPALKVIWTMSAAVAPESSDVWLSRTVPSSLWADRAKDLTAGQKEWIHEVGKELINASAKDTMPRRNLTDRVSGDFRPLASENSMQAAPP
jgi:hypothetical protein